MSLCSFYTQVIPFSSACHKMSQRRLQRTLIKERILVGPLTDESIRYEGDQTGSKFWVQVRGRTNERVGMCAKGDRK